MVQLFFLGGEDISAKDSREINLMAFDLAGPNPNVLVLPWAKASFDKCNEGKRKISEYFRSLGATRVCFAEYSDSFEDLSKEVEGSNLIYLPGGHVTVLLERLKSKGLDSLLRSYKGVIVGRSAGALALCKTGILTKKRNKRALVAVEGLGVVELNLKVHYMPKRDEQLKEFSRKKSFYAISDRSALIVTDDKISYVGSVYLFKDREKTRAS